MAIEWEERGSRDRGEKRALSAGPANRMSAGAKWQRTKMQRGKEKKKSSALSLCAYVPLPFVPEPLCDKQSEDLALILFGENTFHRRVHTWLENIS